MSSNKEITNTTTDYQSLYLYVVEHIDSKGNYDASPLPDNLMREYTYGTEDAAMFRSKTEDGDMEQAKDTQKTKNNLYEKVYTTPIITVFFALAGQLRGEKLSYDLLHLAQEWFYTAKDREAVKFAYLICGLIGLDQVRKSFSEHLYNDLFTMARCEEFTIFLCMACQLSEIRPQKELWFPVIIRESQLPQLLQQEEIPEDIYLAAANVIITYLIFLLPDRDPAEDNIENLCHQGPAGSAGRRKKRSRPHCQRSPAADRQVRQPDFLQRLGTGDPGFPVRPQRPAECGDRGLCRRSGY